MNKLIGISLSMMALGLPGVAQVQPASRSVQIRPAAFQWQNDDDRRRDDDDDRRDRDRDDDRGYGRYGRRDYRGVLRPESQRAFDQEYSRWIADRNSGNQRDMYEQERAMRGIMQTYKIPQDVPFDAIASPSASGDSGYYGNRGGYYGRGDNDSDDRGRGGYYGRGARLSPEDQGKFDSLYSKWVSDTRKGDRDDADRDVKHMQEIMRRNNIPPDVPFDQVASNGGYRRY
ncbi:MAG TPA: hypothetical protein VFA68_17560 [Terriglobales bacterium]|nr:hypothetical protein [Terriglobales bacterium]